MAIVNFSDGRKHPEQRKTEILFFRNTDNVNNWNFVRQSSQEDADGLRAFFIDSTELEKMGNKIIYKYPYVIVLLFGDIISLLKGKDISDISFDCPSTPLSEEEKICIQKIVLRDWEISLARLP